MKSKHLIIYTEEESAKFFLNELLVRIRQDYRLFEWKFSVIAANGKYDQYARLKEKLSGFANNQGFLIVLRDQDEDACLKIKLLLLKVFHCSCILYLPFLGYRHKQRCRLQMVR